MSVGMQLILALVLMSTPLVAGMENTQLPKQPESETGTPNGAGTPEGTGT